jgi:hypothetical protein
MTHTPHTTALYVGIDVSKETLAVATYPDNADHCEALANELAAQPVALVLSVVGGAERDGA